MLTKFQVLYILLLLCLLAGCAVKTPLPVAKNNTATPTRPATSAPTVARTNTPTVTSLPPATSTPTLTATPVPPANPLILQYGWFGGDGGEVTDGYFGRMTPNLALYADGLLVIRQGESYYDEDLTFLETRLSQTEMCDLLAQIEATGYFKEIDPIFTIDRMFGEGQPTLRIQINGPYLKKISSEIERVGDLIPEIGNAYKILKAYRPQGMTPYRSQQLVLWIEPGISPEDGTTSIPWPDNLPPLSDFIPVDRYWNEAGRKLLEGEAAIEALALFDNTLSGRFFKHNNQDYYVIARPLLPNEEFNPDYPGLLYDYTEYDFAEPIPCDNEAALPTPVPSSNATQTQDIVDNLLAQGYVSTEQAPDFTWAGATYHVELYSPPSDSPDPAYLLVSKTANGQTALLEQIAGETLSLDTTLQPLSAGWQPMTHMLPFTFGDIALSNAPHLFYCQKQCEPGRERVGYLWLDEDGNLQHTEPFLQFTGWDTLVQGDVVYHAVAFHDGSFPFAYIYGDAGGSVTTSLKTADLLKNPGPPLRFELSPYQLAGNPATGWNDINGDGAPEIIIFAQQLGTSVCASELLIVQIQPDGSLSQIDTPACVQGATDVDMDGIVELLVGVQRPSKVLDCSGARSCWSTDIYQWDGAAYVPADYAQFADYYLDRMLETAAKMVNKPGPLDRYADGYRLEEIMLIHRLLGRDTEGLAIFDRYTNPVCHKNGQDKVSLLQELRRAYNLPPESNAPCSGEQPVCTLQQEFNLADLPLDDLARLDFVDDDTLALAGWGPRPTPTPGPTPTPRPTTPPVYGDSVTSPRHAYYQAILNLSNGTTEAITPQFEPLNNPCGDSPCALDVLDQSPDGQWQLLHIWANGGGAEGAWLVSAQDTRRLGEPFVPSDSFWQWAQDGSLLWYQQVALGYGLTAENYVVQLASPPLVQAIPVDWDHPLDANGYRPVFSPADKTIYSVRRFEADSDHFEWPDSQRHHFDVTQDLGQPIAQETVPHLAQITWNEATQSFWQVFIDDEGLTLIEMNGQRRLSIPFTFFEGYMESIATSNLELIDIIPQSNITIDPAGQQVALNIRGKRVLLFECGN